MELTTGEGTNGFNLMGESSIYLTPVPRSSTENNVDKLRTTSLTKIMNLLTTVVEHRVHCQTMRSYPGCRFLSLLAYLLTIWYSTVIVRVRRVSSGGRQHVMEFKGTATRRSSIYG